MSPLEKKEYFLFLALIATCAGAFGPAGPTIAILSYVCLRTVYAK